VSFLLLQTWLAMVFTFGWQSRGPMQDEVRVKST
jgi:hypothetical protein